MIANSISEKANELLTQLTIDEKILLCSGKNFWQLNGIERLNIPSIMLADGPHGLRKQPLDDSDHLGIAESVPAVCFPTAVGLASTWNPNLIEKMGHALADMCLQEQVSVLLGPGINIKRSPLCGRNFEYYSEDPYLSGRMGISFVQGVQSKGIGTSLKHFAANNHEHARLTVDAIVDERALREIYLPAFEMTVKEAQPWSVMASYNKLNGEYVTDSKVMLTDILKQEWGHTGLVVTDWGAVNNRVQSIPAGLELEMPGNNGIYTPYIKRAIEKEEISEQNLDKIVLRLLTLILKSEQNLQQNYLCDLAAQHDLARQTVEQSCVLLKNDNAALPLKADEKLAIIGAFAKHPRYQGAGSSQINPTQVDIPITEINNLVSKEVVYSPGYHLDTDATDVQLINEAISVANSADKIVVFAGLPDSYESEGFDRQHMHLPQSHIQLIKALATINKPVILVLLNGSPIELPFKQSIDAILEAYLPGQAGGSGIARILLGEVNPSGKLAETFPKKPDDVLSHHHFPGTPRQVQYRESIWVGYRYFDKVKIPVEYPFGHGLSYSHFNYAEVTLVEHDAKAIQAELLHDYEGLNVTFKLKNNSDIAGYETAQLYVSDVDSTAFRPEQELKGFSKVWLEPGEEKSVNIELGKRSFSYWSCTQAKWIIETGEFVIKIGASSQDIRLILPLFIHSSDIVDSALSSDEIYNQPKVEGFSEQSFVALYGRKIPDPEVTFPFHLNSTMNDIRSTFIGNKVFNKALADWQPCQSDDEGTVKMKRMIRSIIAESPLRSVATMSQGVRPMKNILALIHALNGKYAKAIFTFLKRGI